MKKTYRVTVNRVAFASVDVVAENPDEAMELAYRKADGDRFKDEEYTLGDFDTESTEVEEVTP